MKKVYFPFRISKQSARKIIAELLELAGITIDGTHPWDIQVHNQDLYRRVLAGGSLALGESYMEGWWDCKALDQFIYKILKADLDKKVKGALGIILLVLKARILNMQRKSRAFIIGERHYDIGNDLFENMLDKRMNYSCGYWKDAKTLDESQEAKLDLICRKIALKQGMKVLDIGCGWGGFVKYAAENYGASAVGITVSKEQVRFAKEDCKGLDAEIRLQDYRDVKERFDRIVSVGMIEHVGCKNYRKFLKIVSDHMEDNGLFLLHTIGSNESSHSGEPWTNKYIFPNGMIPSAKQLTAAAEGIFILEDWHNFGTDYDKTLMWWHDNFTKNWDKIKHNYDEKFYRMWNFFLLSSAGSFRSYKNQLWQIVYSKKGIEGGYTSQR